MRSDLRYVMVTEMETEITYRGIAINNKDVADIDQIIVADPEKSRYFISREVCRLWDWRQPNGILKDMVCRSLLLLLESNGLIKLPPRKCNPHNPLGSRKKPAKIEVDKTPIESRISDMSMKLVQIRRTPFEKMFNSLVDQYHYLRYKRYRGTCYKADNWIHVGDTTGRGKGGKSNKAVLSIKAVYVFALTKTFRGYLCHVA